MEGNLEERSPRVHPRYRVDIKVDCCTREMFVANRVTNLSSGGLFIATEKPFPLYSEIQLRLLLDEKTTIEARGKVIWNYDIPKNASRIVPGSGIKFLDLTDEHRNLLENYLDDLERNLSGRA